MIKILIVDDDFLVRTYLKQLVDWDSEGFTLIGDAKDGKTAFNLACGQEKPDIIITDICMPVMNGIELIRELKNQCHKARLIVLSCHDEFAYVKEAMQLGADEYLLKNDLDSQRLLTILRKVSTQLTYARDTIEVDHRMRKLACIGEEKLRQDFLFSLSRKEMSAEEVKVLAKEAGLTTPFANHAAILIRINTCQEQEDNLSEVKQKAFQETFLQMCQNALGSDRYPAKQAPYCFSALKDDEYCILLDFSEEVSVLRQQDTLRMVSDNLRKFARLYFNLTLIVGVGSIQKGLGSLKIAYLKAREVLELSFYRKDFVLFSDAEAVLIRNMPKTAASFAENLENWIVERKTDTIEIEFSKTLEAIYAVPVQPEVMIEWLESMDQKVGIKREAGYYQAIKKFEDLEKAKQTYLQKAEEFLAKECIDIDHPAIRQAVQYIQENYMKPLSLSNVAEFVYLNPAYFSSLFKKNVGSNFSEYLLDCRISKMKKLILMTNKRLKDIALQSGFQDYRHFCKLFKSITGKSPSSYRNMDKNK